MGEVVERLGYDVLGRFSEDVAIGVAGYYADVGVGTLGLVVIQVVHEQIAVMLADELEAGCHFILVVVAGGEGILPLGVDAAHGVFRAVLFGIDTPAGIGIEHVGHYHAALTRQLPVGGIRLAVEVGVGAEERHLLPCVPEGSFVVGARQARALEGVNVVSVGGAADVDVRLPDVSACGGVAMLQHMMALEADFVVVGKVGMPAEQLVAAAELAEHGEQLREARRSVMAFLLGALQRMGAGRGVGAEGEGDVVAEDYLLVFRCQLQVLSQPFHLLVDEFSGRMVSALVEELHVVKAYVVLVAAVEGVVRRSPVLLPFGKVFRPSVLVVVANHGEDSHFRRPEHVAHLPFEHRVVSAVVLHVVAHAQSVDGCSFGQRTDSAAYVHHGLRGEAVHVALLHGSVVGRVVIGVEGVCHLRVAYHNHLVFLLYPTLQRAQREVVAPFVFFYRQIEAGGVVGG